MTKIDNIMLEDAIEPTPSPEDKCDVCGICHLKDTAVYYDIGNSHLCHACFEVIPEPYNDLLVNLSAQVRALKNLIELEARRAEHKTEVFRCIYEYLNAPVSDIEKINNAVGMLEHNVGEAWLKARRSL